MNGRQVSKVWKRNAYDRNVSGNCNQPAVNEDLLSTTRRPLSLCAPTSPVPDIQAGRKMDLRPSEHYSREHIRSAEYTKFLQRGLASRHCQEAMRDEVTCVCQSNGNNRNAIELISGELPFAFDLPRFWRFIASLVPTFGSQRAATGQQVLQSRQYPASGHGNADNPDF
ncbi:MAG: hypothetical protein RL481_1071 [Pseudomonadota bacterium]